MNIKKGDKLLFIEIKGVKIINKEWVTVEQTSWDNEAPSTTLEIYLSNKQWFYDGDSAKTNNEHTIVNHFYHDSYKYLSTSEKDCYNAMVWHLSNMRKSLLKYAREIEKHADDLDTIILAVNNVINESSLKFKV